MTRAVAAGLADYAALLRALRQRMTDLGITHETLDSISGLQTGYSAKLLCDPPIRRIGPITLFLLLQGLGLSVTLAEDPKMLKTLANRMVRRKTPLMRSALSITLDRDFYRRIQRLSRENIPLQRRRTIARKAAQARWAKKEAYEC